MYMGTTSNDTTPPKLFDVDTMKALLEKAEEERKDAPEAYLFAESTLEKFRDSINTPGATVEGRRLMTDAQGLGQIFFGTPVFTIPDCDARLVPINLEDAKDGEPIEFMGTDNVLAGSIESIQKILRWLETVIRPGEWRPWMNRWEQTNED